MFDLEGRAHLENTLGGRNGHLFRRIVHLSMMIFPILYYWHGEQISETLSKVINLEFSREDLVTFILVLIIIIELIRLFFEIS